MESESIWMWNNTIFIFRMDFVFLPTEIAFDLIDRMSDVVR